MALKCRFEPKSRIELTAPFFRDCRRSAMGSVSDSGSHHLPSRATTSFQPNRIRHSLTRGNLTEIRSDAIELSRADPLTLYAHISISTAARPPADLPFTGGALGYFSYDLARRFEKLPTRAVDADKMPEMAVGIHDGRSSSTILISAAGWSVRGRRVETHERWAPN